MRWGATRRPSRRPMVRCARVVEAALSRRRRGGRVPAGAHHRPRRRASGPGIAKGARMRRMVEERHNVAFMVGIILGGLGGALATLFLTPLSGARTREQLRARLARLQPGTGIPDHLDSGTYATTRDGGAAAADASGTGGTGGVMKT